MCCSTRHEDTLDQSANVNLPNVAAESLYRLSNVAGSSISSRPYGRDPCNAGSACGYTSTSEPWRVAAYAPFKYRSTSPKSLCAANNTRNKTPSSYSYRGLGTNTITMSARGIFRSRVTPNVFYAFALTSSPFVVVKVNSLLSRPSPIQTQDPADIFKLFEKKTELVMADPFCTKIRRGAPR
jgi:hypothetical protein